MKSDSQYMVDRSFVMAEDAFQSLVLLYQPLIGQEGLLLYEQLYAESSSQGVSSVQDLTRSLNMAMSVLERAQVKLETFQLLRTFYKKEDNQELYVFQLAVPLRSGDFFASAVFTEQLRQAAGKDYLEKRKRSLGHRSLVREGFQEVTHAVVWTERNNQASSTDAAVMPKSLAPDPEIVFDYQAFLSLVTPYDFPVDLRTPENMELIGRVATVYGLSPETMKALVIRVSSYFKHEFRAKDLRYYASLQKPDITTGKDIYSLPPVSFLMGKQNGAAVVRAEKQTLEHLAVDMHFSNEVINVLVEYVLNSEDNKLPYKTVDAVAAQWARDGVHTKEDALAAVRKLKNNAPKWSKKQQVPDFIVNQGTAEDEPATAEQLEELRKVQAKLRENRKK